MIPFEELCEALERYRHRVRMEAELDGPPEQPNGSAGRPPVGGRDGRKAGGTDGYHALTEENTNELDVNELDVVEDQSTDDD